MLSFSNDNELENVRGECSYSEMRGNARLCGLGELIGCCSLSNHSLESRSLAKDGHARRDTVFIGAPEAAGPCCETRCCMLEVFEISYQAF